MIGGASALGAGGAGAGAGTEAGTGREVGGTERNGVRESAVDVRERGARAAFSFAFSLFTALPEIRNFLLRNSGSQSRPRAGKHPNWISLGDAIECLLVTAVAAVASCWTAGATSICFPCNCCHINESKTFEIVLPPGSPGPARSWPVTITQQRGRRRRFCLPVNVNLCENRGV